MKGDMVFDVKKQPWVLGGLQCIILLWHSLYTFLYMDPQYLVFICYPANLLVALGIFLRYPLFIGIGCSWTILAMPFVFIDYLLTADYEVSGILFHLSGPVIGLIALRQYRLPKYTFLGAVIMGAVFQVMARCFTDKALNINIAFSVWRGWENMFPDYRIYLTVVYAGFLSFFIVFQYLSNKLIYHETH